MKQIFKFLILICCTITAQGALVSTSSVGTDLKILDELDIDSNYITDYYLQEEYQKRLEYTQDRYTEKLNDAHLFVPKIKKVLRENNIPSAFLYLVMAESNFILNANSSKSAKGMWQFMKGTANIYGLETNEYIDERMDIVKSTEAAVKYLKRLHSMFGKWYIAAIAYNCGEGRVIEAITRASLDMYCEDVTYQVCRKEPHILKHREVIKKYQKKRIRFSELHKSYRAVKKLGYKVDINRLLRFQHGLSRQYLPIESRRYIRKIIALAMMNNSDFLIKDENTHLLNRGISDPIATISVKGGILLSDIAHVTGVNRSQLKGLNQHIKKNILPMDKESYNLYIPYSKLSRYNANKDRLKPTSFVTHKVKRGETLASIGRKYGIHYKHIKKYNKLKSNYLRLNQELIVMVDPNKYRSPVSYTVKVGDTISSIADRYNINFKKLMKDNNLKTSMIRIGDKLVIQYQ